MKIRHTALFCLLAAVVIPAHADVIYTSSAAFNAAVSNLNVENYGALTAGTLVNAGDTVDGITYDSFTAGPTGTLLGGIITNQFNSVSGVSLGGNQSDGAQYFFAGDSLTITLPSAVNAFGVFFNVNANSGNYEFTEGSTTASTSSASYDTSTFVFAGVISSTPFETLTITSTDTTLGSYNIPEIEYGSTVPEPGVGLGVGAALGLMAWKRRLRDLRSPRR